MAEWAEINLVNEVRVAGTRHDADNMNMLLQKGDVQGSFYYRPLAGVPRRGFAHGAEASSWTTLPPCPVDMGESPVVVAYSGKWFVTLGRMAEYNGFTYDVAIFDMATMAWDVVVSENRKIVNLGGIDDFGVFGNRLFVAGRDWDGVNPATAWLDSFNLDELSWTFGTTTVWPEETLTIGPVSLSAEGLNPIVAARDGVPPNGRLIDRFTATTTEPVPTGLLPNINQNINYKLASITAFGDDHVITTPDRHIRWSLNVFGWIPMVHPNIVNGHLLPVGTDGKHLVYVATEFGNNHFYCYDRDYALTSFNMGRALNKSAVVRGGSRYFHMRSGHASLWRPSVEWGVFDAETGTSRLLPPSPEILENFGLGATESMVFAVKGNVVYLGHFEAVTQGVVLGSIFKGLSVSATRDVYLVNDSRTTVVKAGTWHVADDDYLVCAAPEVAVFGQIVNI
ncbi:MAG: hypothetical protein FWC76_05420 [Defluviitaleaceae bacterium]|nr:hypothetical protein [Defluviitaleaceae bacterium]